MWGEVNARAGMGMRAGRAAADIAGAVAEAGASVRGRRGGGGLTAYGGYRLPHECDHMGYRVATSYRLPYTHVLYHFMSSTQFWSIDHRLHRLLHTLHTQNRRDMSQSRPISITRIAASADSDGQHLLRTTRGSSFLGQRPAPRVDRQTSTAECGHHSCAVGTLPGASDGP